MQMQTMELRCPYCRAAQSYAGAGHHTCEYCLRGFTAVDANQAASQASARAEAWLRERVGGSTDAEVVDQASRGYIFRERILPELRRDAARAREGLGAWLQTPLILPELARAHAGAPHPLLAHAGRVQQLVELRGRLEHRSVRGFAVDEAARDELDHLDIALDELIHQLNVVGATERGGPEGWAAVRTNLEALAERDRPKHEGDDLSALARERWQLLAALARHSEDCANGTHPPNQVEAVEALAVGLDGLAKRFNERKPPSVEARATALAVEAEARGARTLARWLSSRARLPGARERPLPELYQAVIPSMPAGVDPQSAADLLESWAGLAAVSRQESPAFALDDFGWVEAWATSHCARKRLGLFGDEESVASITPFLLPMWVASLGYSQHSKSLLGGGVEQRALALLDATARLNPPLTVLGSPPEPLRAALTHPIGVRTATIALPATTQGEALAGFRQAGRRRPDLQNARFELRGLVLVPAAMAVLRSRKGERAITTALADQVSISPQAYQRALAGDQLFRQFSR
ncbi:hypothetical protein G6O69_21145 [Pseudenhygromyxa sp. WMMC2535]|uniref:hypothetical protein n=1 Tax=Pseudenhygromyxa sp. WMMC2535 TaxID=2712867 RepID=UPI00155540CE|nr:hypothetical protein [Pseudenhygromyxa sp. WMMC2535]NVB40359.1 hypothetical protein [Pseudenhygromyxa sp. WMMC2535]